MKKISFHFSLSRRAATKAKDVFASVFRLVESVAFLFVSAAPVLLVAQNTVPQTDVVFYAQPDHADWLYKTGEQACVDVQILAYGMPASGVELDYELAPDELDADAEGRVLTNAEGRARIVVGTMKKPGFRDCRMSVTFHDKVYRHHVKVGFSPEKIEPTVRMPNDFDAFWAESKREASECPMLVERTYCAEYSNDKMDCWLVKLQCYRRGQFVYGYLTLPKNAAPKSCPVVFNPPGAGIKPMDPLKTSYFAENGLACFNMEIHGIRPDLDAATYKEISAAFGTADNSYLVNGIDSRENYYMRRVYMACVRALDFLTSLPEWDGVNLVAQGGSQGGALAIVTAALDDRVTLCVANHPALSDMEGYLHGRAGGYPHLNRRFNEQLTPEKVNTLRYFDVANFARTLSIPCFLTWGYNDNTCPPTTSYAVYNVIPSEKEALLTPVNEHWVSTETRLLQMRWIKEHLR